ncbi:nucleotidyltransferase family protein [Marmoricola sp. URHB0036]|uniref:nucleotidyltransferase family protein n=1 Tax=Marmoricola sp. URHB0036 TaxID=1298863 RepID=UPI00041D76E3|nr:hypothetical protein [Marmoricola sp. URHB0036]
MFSVDERIALRQQIIDRAEDDHGVTACALLGSAARGQEDAWSDIDIALQLAPGLDLHEAADEWTAWLGTLRVIADSMTVHAAGAVYRVILLSDSLQVDLSFWGDRELRSTGEPVRSVFGHVGTPAVRPAPEPGALIKLGWLYALHARSAIARSRSWQADLMLTELRNQVLALACLREGLNQVHAREVHRLPAELSDRMAAARASSLDAGEQERSLDATLVLYREEVARHRAISDAFDEALHSVRPTRTP